MTQMKENLNLCQASVDDKMKWQRNRKEGGGLGCAERDGLVEREAISKKWGSAKHLLPCYQGVAIQFLTVPVISLYL